MVIVPLSTNAEPIMDLHQNLKCVEWLLGKWTGSGKGHYPTIKDFEYEETTTIDHVGKPFLIYTQKTVRSDNKQPLHQEFGYFRVPKDGVIEFLNVQPTGVIEILEGTVRGKTIILDSTKIDRTSSAKAPHVVASQRIFTLNNDVLSYTMDMETTNNKLENHLVCSLKKVESSK
jgi:hypothetical protein